MKKLFLLFISIWLSADTGLSDVRLADYDSFVREMHTLPPAQQLERVNRYFNQIVNDYDANTWGKNEYWATPRELVARGRGDCEDFAFAKYITLKELGFATENLMILIVKVEGMRNYHAVLGVKGSKGETLILDNLSWQILSLSERNDLTLYYNLNDSHLIQTTDNTPFVKHLVQSYREVLSSVRRGK